MSVKPSKAGNNLREIADCIKAQTEVEKMVISRILGAAAKIADNQDKLISEVSGVLQGDVK